MKPYFNVFHIYENVSSIFREIVATPLLLSILRHRIFYVIFYFILFLDYAPMTLKQGLSQRNGFLFI